LVFKGVKRGFNGIGLMSLAIGQDNPEGLISKNRGFLAHSGY
jgi:hypothetical protein